MKKKKMKKPWKTINSIKFKDTNQCLKILKRKGYIASPWILNIYKKKNYNYKKLKKPIVLYRVKLKEFGFELGAIEEIGRLINSNDADVYDILEFIAFNSTNLSRPISKKERVEKTSSKLLEDLNEDQSAFIKFLIERYLDEGVESINENNLSTLLKLKYESITKAEEVLGEIRSIKNLFLNFQNNLYSY